MWVSGCTTVTREEEPQLKNCFSGTGLWACLWGTVLTDG